MWRLGQSLPHGLKNHPVVLSNGFVNQIMVFIIMYLLNIETVMIYPINYELF